VRLYDDCFRRNAQKNFFNDNWFANCITILVKKKFSAPLKESFYAKVYAAVKKIPKGKVVTYGQIANILGSPRAARAVGYALNALKKDNLQAVPWQRVINAKGEISFKGDTIRANLQRKLLEQEGIVFNVVAQIDLSRYGWLQKK
jgi:methylated-DNA-protein-cysteine methyltransferase-like protein